MKQKKKKWMKLRHRIARNVVYALYAPYLLMHYDIKIERFREQEKRPYLILLNHQTPSDQFFVGMSFKGPIYYLATEDIFSNGWVSSLIKYLVAPIPIKKQTTDVKAILNCLRIAKEGGTIAIAPEGNRTYSGRTEYMNPTIAQLAKKLNMPIALYRIEGGYGAEPRWSNVVRKGKMHAYVSRVIQPEEYAKLTDNELFAIIKEGLYVNEAVADTEYHHKKCAEYMERAIYICPYCGLSTFESNGDILECKNCNAKVRYLPTKEFKSEDPSFPFHFVADWYDYQIDYINELELSPYYDQPMYRETAMISEVIPYKKKQKISKEANIELYGNKILVTSENGNFHFSFDEANAVTVLGRNKLNVYHDGHIYQFKGSKRFNALKYVHIYHRYQNIKGDNNGKFLGL